MHSADDYIDDLPVKGGGPSVYSDVNSKSPANASIGGSPPNTYTQQAKRVAGGPGGVLICLCAAALVAIGWTVGTVQHAVSRDPDGDSQVATYPTVEPAPTVTVTVEAIPESCRKALDSMAKYLDAAAAVGNAHSHQMDIISAGYVAILQKDWKALNELADKQRKLGRTLGPASSKVLPVLVEVRKELNQCRADVR